jgi:hypothetical protein
MSVRHIEMSAPLEWPGRGHRQAAASWHGLEGLPGDGQVFVLSAGQVDSDRLAAFADNMDAQLRHAIETETTRKSLRSAIRLAIRGHQATDRGVEIRAEPVAPHRRVVCVIYQSIIHEYQARPEIPRRAARVRRPLQGQSRAGSRLSVGRKLACLTNAWCDHRLEC